MGWGVYFLMNRIVVPLSAATRYPFSLEVMMDRSDYHIFRVGLPITTLVRRLGNHR
jgi:hypothetical protein